MNHMLRELAADALAWAGCVQNVDSRPELLDVVVAMLAVGNFRLMGAEEGAFEAAATSGLADWHDECARMRVQDLGAMRPTERAVFAAAAAAHRDSLARPWHEPERVDEAARLGAEFGWLFDMAVSCQAPGSRELAEPERVRLERERAVRAWEQDQIEAEELRQLEQDERRERWLHDAFDREGDR